MTLRGTLGDFGVADILQLIGHQSKTGVLVLKDGGDEVRISFVDGHVVKAERQVRGRPELVANLMVRAGVLSSAAFARAEQTQQRTQRRLDDVLVEAGVVDGETWQAFARLQTTETIYRVFQWRSGTYEFAAQNVDADDARRDAIRTETILMEGFRRVDEWPAVRRFVPSLDVTLQVVRGLPGTTREDGADIEAAGVDPPPRPIGDVERRVFALVTPGCAVADVVDRSCLGEFEACKALAALVAHGVLAVGAPARAAPRTLAVVREVVVAEAVPFLVRCLVYVVLAVIVGGLVRVGSVVEDGLFAPPRAVVLGDPVRDELADVAARRLRAALAVARVKHGSYPTTLDELVATGMLLPGDLTFPYDTPWGYRAVLSEDRYELAQPLR